MNNDDGYRDQYGFGRQQNDGRGVYWQFGPDKQNSDDSHAISCDFIAFTGALPCLCDATRKQGSVWWRHWLWWSVAHHKTHSNTVFPIKWPVEGPDGESWIQGIDFD